MMATDKTGATPLHSYDCPSDDGAKLMSVGSPVNLNRLVRYSSVQEIPMHWGDIGATLRLLAVNSTSNSALAEMRMRFTELALLSASYYQRQFLSMDYPRQLGVLALNDCQLHTGVLSLKPQSHLFTCSGCQGFELGLTNNLFHRVSLVLVQGDNGDQTPFAVSLRQNLFRRGVWDLEDQGAIAPWGVYDNLFDEPTMDVGGTTFPNGYNGYVNVSVLPNSSGGDVTVSVADYQAGPLGAYYYPTSGGQLSGLLDAGSRSATAAGLAHYTTRTDQTQEGTAATNTVDIGFHYAPVQALSEIPKSVMTITASTTGSGFDPADVLNHLIDDDGWQSEKVQPSVEDCTNTPTSWLMVDLGADYPVTRVAYHSAPTNSGGGTIFDYEIYVVASTTVGASVKKLTGSPMVQARFTGWSLLAGVGEHFQDANASLIPGAWRHCQFGGGQFTCDGGVGAVTNCLWERVAVTFKSDEDGAPFYLFNNLHFGGTIYYRARGTDPVLRAYDNLFDQTAISRGSGSEYFTADHNGYVTNQSRLSTGAHDVLPTNHPVYQTGALGRYYYPTNDGNLSRLLDAGSRSVEAAGLPGYTMHTNQSPDNCTVDIGFHYRGAGGNLTVSTNTTDEELARRLVPAWVTVANAKFTGAVVARGTFSGGVGCGLPIDQGVILASGDITNAIGPNDKSDKATLFNTNGYNGDAHLDDLVGGSGTEDAAVLEFDIVATNLFTLEVQYIFASEEYPEFSGSEYNDLVGIFVSTNHTGTSWIIMTNDDIALVPGTTNVPVSVNTINGGCVSDFNGNYVSPTNAQYYSDNHDPHPYSAVCPYAVAVSMFNIQHDGLTVLLTVQAAIPANVTNHVKIAIADYGDANYDSAVFLRSWPWCEAD